MIDWVKSPNPLFTTATLPDQLAQPSPELMKAWRDEIIRSTENYLSEQIPMVWRVEWKPRLTGKLVGTFCPHLHIVMFTRRFIPEELFMSWWMRVIGEKTYAKVEVERCRQKDAAAYYLAKYCAKLPDASPSLVKGTYRGTGRHWGIRRASRMVWGPEAMFADLDDDELELCIRQACRAMKHFDPRYPSSFSLFGKEGRAAVEAIRKKRLDESAYA